MGSPQNESEFKANLINLKAGSFQIILIFTAVISYTWLMINVWNGGTLSGVYRTEQLIAWLGNLLLIMSSIVAWFIKDRSLAWATRVLTWGILVAALCVVLALPSQISVFLLIVPVVFASVLLTRRGFVQIALLASGLTLVVSLGRVSAMGALTELVLITLVMVMVVLASWLSTQNLYTALAWIWAGYERARRNEALAREQQGELARALKSLDEALYRLERANYMLTIATERAEEARRLKQQFAQNISHELRTPLNLIVGFTETMTRSPEYYGGQLAPAYMRDLRIVYRNAHHLQDLVNDVLDLARIEAAQMGIMPEKTDPAALVQDVADTARSLVESRGPALYTEIAPDLPQIWLDPTRIRQVLFNLLNNAARFTEEGSITVRLWQHKNEVRFSVTDTGVGIAAQDLQRIFEEFQQAEGSSRRRQGGTGLGLAISKRFVDLHHGRMWVESEVGKGSTFYFSLPVNRTQLEVELESKRFAQAEPVTQAEEENVILLVVTPNLSTAALLTHHVQGCRPVVALNLDEARQMAQQLLPQAVVIDRACGITTPTELEKFAQSCDLPETAFMACPLSDKGKLHPHLDIDGFLTKPISRQSLWDVLRRLGGSVNKILIIENDNDFVQLLSRMLDTSVRPYQIITAYNGQEGLTLMRHHQPDAVLLDLGLPDMQGTRVVKQIRATPVGADIPIVIISGQADLEADSTLRGTTMLTRPNGLVLSEIVYWIEREVTSTVVPLSTRAKSSTKPAP
jgi:signal transduction histidine kinase/CheY-like chemotaxis protein